MKAGWIVLIVLGAIALASIIYGTGYDAGSKEAITFDFGMDDMDCQTRLDECTNLVNQSISYLSDYQIILNMIDMGWDNENLKKLVEVLGEKY